MSVSAGHTFPGGEAAPRPTHLPRACNPGWQHPRSYATKVSLCSWVRYEEVLEHTGGQGAIPGPGDVASRRKECQPHLVQGVVSATAFNKEMVNFFACVFSKDLPSTRVRASPDLGALEGIGNPFFFFRN